jgi:hypothetical protein
MKFVSFQGINLTPNGTPQKVGELVVRSDIIVMLTQAMVHGKLVNDITLMSLSGGGTIGVEGSLEQVQAKIEESSFA